MRDRPSEHRPHIQSTPASEIVRRGFAAFEQGDRDAIEAVLAEDFTFSSPPDPHLDRAGFFERCWPNNASIRGFTFTRILEDCGEVFVTYELEKTDGKRGRNTEYFVVEDGLITRQDVYFGPSLPGER